MTDATVPDWADAPVIAPATPNWADVPLPPVDKYRATAEANLASNPMQQGQTSDFGGYAQRMAMGIPWTDEIRAAATVPAEMIRHGTINPAEAYRYGKARENLLAEKTRENTAGAGGMIAEAAGALGSGAGVFGRGTQLAAKTIPFTTAKIPASAVNYIANTGKAGAFGAFAGAGEGDTMEARGRNALVGGVFGTALGAGLPIATKSLMAAGSAAQLPRLRNVDAVATETMEKLARDAGITMQQLQERMAAANAAGQPAYKVVDELGTEARAKLTALNKMPGATRDNITEFLTTRDLNMPHRVVEGVLTKFGAPGTAAQETQRLIQKAGDDARPFYKAAEEQKGAIWNDTIAEGLKHPDIKKGLAHGLRIQSTESAMGGKPFNPTDAAITGFDKAGDPIISGVPNFKTLQTAKIGLDSMIQAQTDTVTGKMTNYGRALVGLKNRLNDQIASFRPDYATANKLFSDPMRITEAVQTGRDMATRGSPRDTVPAFSRLNAPEQQGVRIGWADKVLEPLERTGNFPGLLRAKSPKGQAELEAMSPYGPATLREALAREEAMKLTSNKALGGSDTAEKLAGMAQAPGGAEVFGVASNIASGNVLGGVRGAYDMLKNYAKGESEAQRAAIARALLENRPDKIAEMAKRVEEYERRRRGINPWQPDKGPARP